MGIQSANFVVSDTGERLEEFVKLLQRTLRARCGKQRTFSCSRQFEKFSAEVVTSICNAIANCNFTASLFSSSYFFFLLLCRHSFNTGQNLLNFCRRSSLYCGVDCFRESLQDEPVDSEGVRYHEKHSRLY